MFICIKLDFASNDLQRLICHKTQINKQTMYNNFTVYGKSVTHTFSF